MEALARVSSGPFVRESLLEATQDKQSAVRAGAAMALSPASSEPSVRERLIELTRDKDAVVRFVAEMTVAGEAPSLQLILPKGQETTGGTRPG